METINDYRDSHHSRGPLISGSGNANVTTTNIVTGSTTPVRRPVAEVHRRRLIKKHIQQKYMLCGFAIHVRVYYFLFHLMTFVISDILVGFSGHSCLSLWQCGGVG